MPDGPEPISADLDNAHEWHDENEWDEERNDLVYLKYMFEGAATLADLSAVVRSLADGFDRQALAGWRLNAPVRNGSAHDEECFDA